MKAIYNSRVSDQESIQITSNNRGFCYGDGLFETIVTGPDRINLIERHLDRLKNHCHRLSMDAPEELFDELRGQIDKLTKLNNINGNCRSKIIVWRKEGGLYTPSNDQVEYLILQKETVKPLISYAEKVGISQKVRNHYSIHSAIKTINALNYVLAGKEKQERKLDEIILLDQNNKLSETHIGSLFWIKYEKVFTPSLKTGCIDGVMRNFIIEFLEQEGILIEILDADVKEIEDASSIFSTNASGLTFFNSFNGRTLSNPESFLQKLIIRLQQP